MRLDCVKLLVDIGWDRRGSVVAKHFWHTVANGSDSQRKFDVILVCLKSPEPSHSVRRVSLRKLVTVGWRSASVFSWHSRSNPQCTAKLNKIHHDYTDPQHMLEEDWCKHHECQRCLDFGNLWLGAHLLRLHRCQVDFQSHSEDLNKRNIKQQFFHCGFCQRKWSVGVMTPRRSSSRSHCCL